MERVNFKSKPLEERRRLVRLVVARLVKAYGLGSVKELTTVFDCSYGAIKNWGSAGRVPLDPMFQCHFETGVSLDWLMHGEDPAVLFSPKKVDALSLHLAGELASGVRFQLIDEKCEGGIDMLSLGLRDSLIKWMKIEVVDMEDVRISNQR